MTISLESDTRNRAPLGVPLQYQTDGRTLKVAVVELLRFGNQMHHVKRCVREINLILRPADHVWDGHVWFGLSKGPADQFQLIDRAEVATRLRALCALAEADDKPRSGKVGVSVDVPAEDGRQGTPTPASVTPPPATKPAPTDIAAIGNTFESASAQVPQPKFPKQVRRLRKLLRHCPSKILIAGDEINLHRSLDWPDQDNARRDQKVMILLTRTERIALCSSGSICEISELQGAPAITKGTILEAEPAVSRNVLLFIVDQQLDLELGA